MSKTVRNVMYIIITVICVVSIFVAVYAQFFMKKSEKKPYSNSTGGSTTNEATQLEIKDDFKDLFTNVAYVDNYNSEGIDKIYGDKDIVYTYYNEQRDEEGKYKMSFCIPLINIKDVDYNDRTFNLFVNKFNDIVKNTKEYTIYNVSYTAYINNDVLSVAIMATIKEGENAQRLLIQTYNYNLKTKKDVTIDDILESRDLDKDIITKQIKYEVEKAAEDAKSMQNTGYNVFERDTESDIYDVSNVGTFIQGPNGELYIIYAYGNTSYTSEMDIIVV